MVLKLLPELQPEVDACHNSPSGQKLLSIMERQKNTQHSAVKSHLSKVRKLRSDEKAIMQVTKESALLETLKPAGAKRKSKAVVRYGNFVDNSSRIKMTCIYCYESKETEQISRCHTCYIYAHVSCGGLTKNKYGDVSCTHCLIKSRTLHATVQ